MTQRKIASLVATFALALGVTACNPAAPEIQTPAGAVASNENLARADSQGSVEFVVTPLNLDAPGETLDFEVAMNTHSVDLGWDLAALSVLTTDTGLEVRGQSWPAGGGHHLTGPLIFPARTADGQRLLDGASRLKLTIADAGAPKRVFEWALPLP